MIRFSDNSRLLIYISQQFYLPRCTTTLFTLLFGLLLTLLHARCSRAESRSNDDTHRITASVIHNSNQLTAYATHRTHKTKYAAGCTSCIDTQLRSQSQLSLPLQMHLRLVSPDYDAPPNSAFETCCLSVKNEMSQYRAYFVPGAMDPWGLFKKLWTFSGINNVDPRNDKYRDYVGAAMIAAGHQPDYQSSSHAGNVDWYGEAENQENHDAREIGWLNSVEVLNRDANDRSDKLFEESGSLCNLCIPTQKILVVMAAPKTQTVPAPTNCCDVTVVSWVNSLDGVPNQTIGPGAGPWADSNGDGEFPDAGSEEHMQTLQNYWGQWGTANIFNTNDPNDIWNHHIRNFQAATNHASQQLGNGEWDHVLVCHSQGCNIAMHLLPKICNYEE